MSDPHFLDLDALEPPVSIKVKFGGVVHELKPVTVEDFVENVKLLQSVKFSGDLAEDIATTKKILLRAFPTMTEEMLGQLRIDQLKQLADLAMKANGQVAAEQEAQAAAEAQGAENPQ